MTARPGQLRESVTLQNYTEVDDGAGNWFGEWFDVATVPARIQSLKGSEEVLASRLTGVQPIVVTIRNGGDVAEVGTDWRLINVGAGLDAFGQPRGLLNIRSIIRSERGDWIDLLCESGVAT